MNQKYDPQVLASMVKTAYHLSAIQFEGVDDSTGFSNADKVLGAHLAAIVHADPTNEENVVALAMLLGKYVRQSTGIVGHETVLEWKEIAKGGKITREQRDRARNTVVSRVDVHPQFGASLLLSFQKNDAFAYELRSHGSKPFYDKEKGEWFWRVRAAVAEASLAGLKGLDAVIVGDTNLDNIDLQKIEAREADTSRKIACRIEGKRAILSFAYVPSIVAIVKTIPDRRYDGTKREWGIPVFRLAEAAEILRALDGVNIDEVIEAAKDAPVVQRPVAVAEDPIFVDENLVVKMRDYQREGVAFLTQPLNPIREQAPNVRGFILGDDMGLGKTFQAIIGAHATAGSKGRILVICPASLKINWTREITHWLADQTMHIVNGAGPNPDARWNIINYDVIQKHYRAIEAMQFDCIIIDEAHYVKNYDSNRSKLVVGGKGAIVNRTPDARNTATKEKVDVDGLCVLAKKRVYMLTGTPLTNRPKDLFQLLRGVGHPLGKNFRYFAQRYCDPQFNGWGHTYNGATNINDLRRKIDPIFLQRKKDDKLDLPGKVRAWVPVEVDTKAYRAAMADYEARRKAGELSKNVDELGAMTEARVCVAVAKVPRTVEMIENAVEQGEKVVVFSVYTRVIDGILESLAEKKINAVSLTGDKSQKQRQAAIDAFQADAETMVFVGQLHAAGVGITLTAGTQVFVNDLDWVPANHLQAEDRTYRIGQTKMVNVTYVIAAGTIDEDLAVLLEEKFETINEFEGVTGSLFAAFNERIRTAPQNQEAKVLREQTEKLRAAGRAA